MMTTTPAAPSAVDQVSEAKTHSDIIRGPPGQGERFSQYVIHNGVCYVSGQVNREAGDGSLAAQTQGVLAKIDAILAHAGTDKSRLLSATIWLANIEVAPVMNAVWDAWVDRNNLPVRACVQSALLARDMEVEIQVTAAMPSRAGIISTPDAAAAVGPYNQAVRVENGTVYLSGCIGLLPGNSGNFAGPTVQEQTRQCLANMDAIVKASGATKIVKTTILLDDIADFAAVNELYKAYFGDGPVPARSCFAAKALPKGALVEIEAIAIAE
jgi:2-iminobutanoate/2-iminopropanoate deaminase